MDKELKKAYYKVLKRHHNLFKKLAESEKKDREKEFQKQVIRAKEKRKWT